MKVYALDGAAREGLANSLDRFETQFSYPLGKSQRFHVSHGNDYSRFFRAMGEAQCFVAEHDGEIVGSLAVAIRRLRFPDLTEHDVGYLGDLKISPRARGGRTLLRLAGEAAAWIRLRATAYFGVVMDGTEITPESYSGRADLPAFQAVAGTMVIRMGTSNASEDDTGSVSEVEPRAARECFRELSAGRYATPCGNPEERSLAAPVWLVRNGGSACGCLEDTRRAKRLILGDGSELSSGHLSSFAYRDVQSGAALVGNALTLARRLELPGVFFAIAPSDCRALLAHLGEHQATLAPATIFGHGLAPGFDWNLNASEI